MSLTYSEDKYDARIYRCVNSDFVCRIYPEWNVHAEFVNGHLSRALSLDAKLSSHPIEVECPDANKINQIFDSLSYSKAASGTLRNLLVCPFMNIDDPHA